METGKFRRFAIYSRKSKFTGKGESIENQMELCRQYITAHFSREEAEKALIYEDEGFSGKNLERPRFKQMMADAAKKQFSAIVVYRLDRISRNIGDFAKLIEELGQRHIDFISIREQFDTSSPMGRAMMYIASVFSQLERETIAERIRDNMRELSKTGRWLGGITPTGYSSESMEKITVDGKVKKACHLKIVPEEMETVKLIFDRFLKTGSLTQVGNFLHENQYTTKHGKAFSRFALKNILTNPVYMVADAAAYTYFMENSAALFAESQAFDGVHGIMAYNRTYQQPGKAHTDRPMAEWIVSVGRHPGVIPGEKWIQVQNLLAANKTQRGHRRGNSGALLSGLLYCKACGSPMRPKRLSAQKPDGQPAYSYLCLTKEKSHREKCQMANARGESLDEKVLSTVIRLKADRQTLVRCLVQVKKELAAKQSNQDGAAGLLNRQLAENEKNIRLLAASLGKASSATGNYLLEEIETLHKKGELLRNQLAQMQENPQPLSPAGFAQCWQQLESLSHVARQASAEEKKRLLNAILKKVVWDGKDAAVYLLWDKENVAENPLRENSK